MSAHISFIFCQPMESIHTHFIRIQEQITQAEKESSRPPHAVRLMAASKQQPIDIIEEAINAGMNLFGENKVQEAQAKWPALKEKHPHIQCHLIGHLQSNKCDEAVALFDCIHSLDSIKLAECLKKSMTKQNKEVPCFIQVNIGEEPQKDPCVLPKHRWQPRPCPNVHLEDAAKRYNQRCWHIAKRAVKLGCFLEVLLLD